MECNNIKGLEVENFIRYNYEHNNPNTNKPFSKRLLQELISVGFRIFEFALDNELIENIRNPFTGKKKKIPKDTPKTERHPINDTQKQFILNSYHRAQIASLIMIILIIVLCVCVCSVMVKLVARGFEITCLVTLSPLFFATLVGDTTSQYFKKFINAFLSTAGYIVFMAIVYVVATIWIDECTHMRVSGITDLAMSFISILPRCLIVIACCNIMRKPPKVLTSLVDGG